MGVISAPVNDRPVGFHVHDLEAFRLVFPPRLIGSPFVMYGGANRALKVSRASVVLLYWPGLLRQLTRLTTYAPASQKAGRRCDRVNNERDSGCGKGCNEGREPTIASVIGDRQRDPQGMVISTSGSAPCCRTFSIFASPETLGATQGGYRCEENQRLPVSRLPRFATEKISL
jgi:hypothetical protein